MRQYNLIALFILIIITITISSYFFYLDIIYKDKIVQKDIKSFGELKREAQKPVLVYANKEELDKKLFEYKEILQELNLDAKAEVKNSYISISGAIVDDISYMLLKRLFDIIKNDEAKVLSTCIGQGCNDSEYGFLVEIKPYKLDTK